MSCQLVLAIFAVAAMLQLSAAEVEFPGKLVNSPYSIAPFFNFPSTCEGTDIYTVCTGCSSYLVCAPGIDAIETDCPTEKPYCNKNACSTTLSSEYECMPDSLKCTGIGFYPDPKLCQYYHYCEASGQQSNVYDCQPNNVFNPATNMCKQKRLAADCMSVTCDPNKVFQTFGTSKTYFAYCGDDGKILMLKCDKNYVFNGAGCAFQCPGLGNFPHTDPNKYNECYFSGTKLVSKEVSCPGEKVFDADKQVCLTAPQ